MWKMVPASVLESPSWVDKSSLYDQIMWFVIYFRPRGDDDDISYLQYQQDFRLFMSDVFETLYLHGIPALSNAKLRKLASKVPKSAVAHQLQKEYTRFLEDCSKNMLNNQRRSIYEAPGWMALDAQSLDSFSGLSIGVGPSVTDCVIPIIFRSKGKIREATAHSLACGVTIMARRMALARSYASCDAVYTVGCDGESVAFGKVEVINGRLVANGLTGVKKTLPMHPMDNITTAQALTPAAGLSALIALLDQPNEALGFPPRDHWGVLDGHQLTSIISRGGSCCVYKARSNDNVPFALKAVLYELEGGPKEAEVLWRIRTEFNILTRIAAAGHCHHIPVLSEHQAPNP